MGAPEPVALLSACTGEQLVRARPPLPDVGRQVASSAAEAEQCVQRNAARVHRHHPEGGVHRTLQGLLCRRKTACLGECCTANHGDFRDFGSHCHNSVPRSSTRASTRSSATFSPVVPTSRRRQLSPLLQVTCQNCFQTKASSFRRRSVHLHPINIRANGHSSAVAYVKC